MKVTTLSSFNMDFPSKNYKKYKSQTKTNPLLNKLSQDAGYPQDVLNHSTISHNRTIRNYLEENKKNLRNFFSDRLPSNDVDIWSQSYTIDPSKLFEMKKRQQQLRFVTRSTVSQKLQNSIRKKDSNKVSQIFQLNDKNYDFKQSFIDSSLKVSLPYQYDNFMKGTTSYIQKYQKIGKKQAYSSVFGPDASAVPRKMSIEKNNQTLKPRPSTYAQARKKKYNINSSSKQLQRKKFSSLIQKMDRHRQSYDPENKCGLKPYVPPPQIENKEAQKSQMITWIRDVTKQYKFHSIDADSQKIKDLEDIQKMDSQYYRQLRAHKIKRLQSREGQVFNSITSRTQRSSIMNSGRLTKHMRNKTPHALELSKINSNSSVSLKQQEEDSQVSSSDEQIEEEKPAGEVSIGYYLRKLGRQLINALEQSHISGIKNAFNAYKAFWKNPEPYQKSGSYAFFKAIKKGDLQGIKKFLSLDPDYIYQRDHKYRSPLIYATANNYTKIVQFFLTLEINVNQKSMNRKSSLYYAVKNQNIELVKNLLQAGAIPWSSKNCNFATLLKQKDNQKLNILFKSARKIWIAVKMKPSVALRVAFWKDVKYFINQKEIFSF